MTALAAPARGHVEDGWGRVADAFRANFDGNPGEVGAACCVYVGGRPVVDLWGGLADREANRPWDEDTIALVASTTKGATAICAHLLAQRGELDLDAPVVEYWPEFGAAGKEQIPVRWLLSHQAGLPVVDGPLTFEDACAWHPVIRALEAQKPEWQPGTEHVYHRIPSGSSSGRSCGGSPASRSAPSSPTRSLPRSGCAPGSGCPRSRRDGWPGSSTPRSRWRS